MSRVKESLGVILGTLLIIAGYLIPPPRWTHFTSIPVASELSPEFLALSISIVFFFAVIGGYAILASASNKTMTRAAIISSAVLVGSLTTAMLAGEMKTRSFEVAKSITLSAGTLLGGFLRVPQPLRPLEPEANGGCLSGADLHAYMEKRIESSHYYRRHIIDNLIRWYTVFIGINYVSMGWFAAGGEEARFVALIAAMFITQNVLGIMACLRIKRYLLESSYQIARYEQVLVGTSSDKEREAREAFIPSRVYGRAIQLMIAGLIFIVLVWVALAVAKERRPTQADRADGKPPLTAIPLCGRRTLKFSCDVACPGRRSVVPAQGSKVEDRLHRRRRPWGVLGKRATLIREVGYPSVISRRPVRKTGRPQRGMRLVSSAESRP